MPGAGAHSISRFVDRGFRVVDRADFDSLMDAIGRATERWDWTWLSFAAMSSHLHYGHLAGQMDPDPFFRSVHTRFAVRYHRRPGRETLGPVFAGRPEIHPIREGTLAQLVAYHHRNPSEANMVRLPRDSHRTSHRFYLRLDEPPPWLDVERCLDLLGFRDTAAGRERFDQFVNEVDLSDRPWDRREAAALRKKAVRSGGENVDWARIIGVARAVARVPQGVPLTSRCPAAVEARLLVAMVATRALGQTCSAVALALGMTAGGVSNLLTRKASQSTGAYHRMVEALEIDE